MFKYLKKYWFLLIIAPLFMLGEIGMDLVQPDLMKTIVDDGVLAGNMALVLDVGLKMIVLVLLGGISGFLCGVFTNLAGQRFGNDLRKDLFSKIMNLSFQQTDKISTGSLVTRLTNDVTQVQFLVMMSVRGFVRSTFMFIGGIIMLYRQAPVFAWVTACGLPFVVLIVIFFMGKASKLFTVVQKKLDGVNNVMQEDVAGARVVKAYVKEDYEMQRFDKANDELCSVNLRVQSLLAFMGPCMNIVLNLCVVGVIMVGGLNVKSGAGITTGEIMAAITYVAMILHGVTFMANIFQVFTRAKASADRINEVLSSEKIITDGTIPEENTICGEIEFRNVSFSYPNSGGEKVLDNISFKLKKGETLAVMGATGCGKTSLINLIPRFYDATEGEVLVNGINVKNYTLEDLRNRITTVLQKAELYSRSIEENIRFGKQDATEWEIKKAAEIAQADDFICAAPYGYYTPVTEGGHSLSGGQKQRISIARAVLKNSEILIFDDATSALDLKTEANLYAALKEHCPDTTKIIIAQRIASVKNADRIAVLENGRISAMGTHEELLKTSDIYSDIYRSQLKEEGDNI
ncbi:MAG: ABC transporter ATP-binding protein [Ruminococcaceae bacterium]|nr:ABC transporter ATP-binding protein [Oscillospiraceae bacterium]